MQKERLRAEEMFVLDDTGAVVEAPPAAPPANPGDPPPQPLKLSECAPLFMAVRAPRSARLARRCPRGGIRADEHPADAPTAGV